METQQDRELRGAIEELKFEDVGKLQQEGIIESPVDFDTFKEDILKNIQLSVPTVKYSPAYYENKEKAKQNRIAKRKTKKRLTKKFHPK